jgi:hypothetical protein
MSAGLGHADPPPLLPINPRTIFTDRAVSKPQLALTLRTGSLSEQDVLASGVEDHAKRLDLVACQTLLDGLQNLSRRGTAHFDAKSRLHEAGDAGLCERMEEAIDLLLIPCANCDLWPHADPFPAA